VERVERLGGERMGWSGSGVAGKKERRRKKKEEGGSVSPGTAR
jgi:hypothetical protein